jgi:transposase-like protein
MTNDHRKPDARITQEALLDDSDFLLEIFERVLQEVLEAEMTQHIGARPLTSALPPARATATATSRGH